MKELILNLLNFEFIKIISSGDYDFENMDFFYSEVQGYFLNQQELCIGEETVGIFFESIIKHLKKAIDGKLQLHESFINDLGIMKNEYWNEYDREKPGYILVPSLNGGLDYWIGQNYEVWTTYNKTKPKVTTWIYNDNENNIVFEVTELYKWSFFPDDLKDPEYVTYDEFMKNYKPLIHRFIPRDIAIVWVEQLMKVYRKLYSTEENFQKACQRLNW